MSLDVYLQLRGVTKAETSSGIFIRENGQMKEISEQEWAERFPGREPCRLTGDLLEAENDEVFWKNITHNLSLMAGEAGIYEALWRPEEIGILVAGQLMEPLTKGLELLKSDPERFKKLNPANGWGNYEGLVEFVSEYLDACKDYPSAEIYISR